MTWRELAARMERLAQKTGLVGQGSPYWATHAIHAEELLHELAHAIVLGFEHGPLASDQVSKAVRLMDEEAADIHEAQTCAVEILIARRCYRPIGVDTLAAYANQSMNSDLYPNRESLKREIERFLDDPGTIAFAQRGMELVARS